MILVRTYKQAESPERSRSAVLVKAEQSSVLELERFKIEG